MKELQLDDLVPEFWSDQWYFTPKISSDYEQVRRISNTHVVKTVGVAKDWRKENDRWTRNFIFGCREELETHTRVYNSGLSSPKPEGLFKVIIRAPLKRGIIIPGFVMEYIPGQTLQDLYEHDEDVFFEAVKQRDAEIQKAKDMGFSFCGNDHLSLFNAIWNPEQQKTYLIDFALWNGGF